jgi:uncharacterized protein (DUF1684 family)
MPQPLPEWRADRLAALAAPDGWLNLTDRVEIAPGNRYAVGQGAENGLHISAGPDHLGVLTVAADGSASLTTPQGQELPFTPIPGAPPRLSVANLILEIHVAEGQPALRVRQIDHPRRLRDPGLRYFPDAPDWVIRAKWQPLAAPQQAEVDMIGGRRETVQLTHQAVFTHDGQVFTLMPTHWKSGAPMFVIRDLTAGSETYPAARFLIGEDVTDSEITLDFNKAHTPPCGFTDYAICPLPPRENILPFGIEAGEKRPL